MALNNVAARDKIFYTTARLTSDMGIPILALVRSHGLGHRSWPPVRLDLDGSHAGNRFVVLSGEERILYDQDVNTVEGEDTRHRRNGARDEGS